MTDYVAEVKRQTNRQSEVWLPFVLLILVGVCMFLTESHEGVFVGGGLYGGNSFHGLALSNSLMSSNHPLFVFSSKELHDGRPTYDAYNRFPIFPFLLTGLLTYPFENHLALQIYAARQLMNVFFFLAIVVVFMLVDKLVKSRYLALSVALLAFSSYHMLSYNDMIFNDIPALLGFVIALHGVVMAQRTKLKRSHILIYALFPTILGWQPYAVYVTWALIEGIELLLRKKDPTVRRSLDLFKKPSFVITSLAVAWGIGILGLQLFNEWRIVGGSFVDLPSVNSALWRSGIASSVGHTQYAWTFDWISFLPSQAHSIALMLIPFWPIFQIEPGINASVFLVASLIVYTLLRYLNDRSTLNKVHLIMVFSGLMWAIPMRHFVALHDFQSMFHVGFVVSVYIMLLSRINPKAWKLLAIDVAMALLITISISNHFKTPTSGANQITAQFQNIRDHLPGNSRVYIDGDRERMVGFSAHAIDFFLSGSWFTTREEASYVVSRNPNFGGEKLTSNPDFNLFKISSKH